VIGVIGPVPRGHGSLSPFPGEAMASAGAQRARPIWSGGGSIAPAVDI